MNQIKNIAKIANLSRLAPIEIDLSNEKEVKKFLGFFREKDFNEVVDLIEDSLSVDVSGIDSSLLFFADDETLIRSDKNSIQRNTKQDILKNSKNQNGDYFISPKIIE
jgi:aspartyl/glutamyl-tRNA(Asn/Gln) amidotransferase C subunit